MARFDDSFRLELDLEAQSPMLHFQSRETGATIRASEVKPKLDSFLIKKLCKITGKDLKALREDVEYGAIFQSESGEKDALKYKMQVFCKTPPEIIPISSLKYKSDGKDVIIRDYPLYFGNIKVPAEKKMMGVISNPTVVIHCFVPKLREMIEKYIAEFFFVTNFGTRQNKGFGSFIPAKKIKGEVLTDYAKETIAGFLKEHTGIEACYCMTVGPQRDYQAMFTHIDHYYHLMKSGYNSGGEYEKSFLFKYMSKLGIGSEKAFMKQNGISPVVNTSGYEQKPTLYEKYCYVRAFLGTTEAISYLKDDRKRTTIKILPVEKYPERVQSPVFFKIVKDTVFIATFPVPDKVYGKEFSFDGFKEGKLTTPERELFEEKEFNIEDLLDKYTDHYNSLRKGKTLTKYLKNAPEVKKI